MEGARNTDSDPALQLANFCHGYYPHYSKYILTESILVWDSPRADHYFLLQSSASLTESFVSSLSASYPGIPAWTPVCSVSDRYGNTLWSRGRWWGARTVYPAHWIDQSPGSYRGARCVSRGNHGWPRWRSSGTACGLLGKGERKERKAHEVLNGDSVGSQT